jgi:L-iditol 2-dehydrogenase
LEGTSVIATDLIESRLKLARQFGAQWTLRGDDPDLPAKVQRATRGRGLDAAIIAVPSDDVARQAQMFLRGGGQLMLFAHTKRGDMFACDPAAVCVDEKDLLGSYSADFTLQREVARLVFSRHLDVRRLITHRFPLEQTTRAIALASHPTPDSLKIVVNA